MKSKALIFAVAAGMLLSAVPFFAHHGDAGRYEDKLTTLTGSVVEVQLVDPHCIVVFDVPDEPLREASERPSALVVVLLMLRFSAIG